MSYINEHLFEINEYPKVGDNGEYHTVKDYFYYDSNVREYGYRNLLVPRSKISNFDELPDEKTIKDYINNNTPFLKKVTDFNNQTETWIFEPVS